MAIQSMKFFTYKIDGKNVIHARPAGALVNTAKGFSSNITIKNGNRDADAKRLFSVMSLGAKHGDELAFFINGVDEAEAAAALEDTLKKSFENDRG